MGIKDRAVALGKMFRLDSHHAIERFGVLFGVFALLGAVVIGGSGAAAFTSGRDVIAETALYTPEFTTSKTQLQGDVEGVYTNEAGDRALVMMSFDSAASISRDANDYEAFLLGSDVNLRTEPVSTSGVRGSFHVFGSTGYVGVVLEADEPFDQQVLNLTVRANDELATTPEREGPADELAGDETFERYDQWRVFMNPGASGAQEIAALESRTFDPARAYYDIVLKTEEQAARDSLDSKLAEMRTDLRQIEAYTSDLETTKVDGLFLRPPEVPASIAGDQVTGETAAEAEDGVSTLALETDSVVPGGFDLNWRAGDVYEGYLDVLVPPGQTYMQYLSEKSSEGSEGSDSTSVSNMQWILSDGSNLTQDYSASDVTMRPLTTVMNNLSQSYSNYMTHKREYQSALMLELLRLDVDLRDVQSNSTVRDDAEFLTIF